MLRWILTIVQLFSAVAIIGLVLLQRGKGAEAGAGFGAGASGTVFGARGATTALSRATAVLAAVFMINSLALAYMGTPRPRRRRRSSTKRAAGSLPFRAARARPRRRRPPRELPRPLRRRPRRRHRHPPQGPRRSEARSAAPPAQLRCCRRGGIGRHTSLRG